ncbi:MAG: TatD family hydrolase [Candidatus Acidiferrales bacterium]
MAFTDSHAHLDDARFAADLPAVLERARAGGVERILTISGGTNAEELSRAVRLAESHPHLWAAVGLHPHEARHLSDDLLAALETLARSPRVVAWGEIGLDYHYDHSPREVQREAFRRQLQSARALRLPVIIHCREAWDDCLKLLEVEWASSGLGGILHCFTGDTAAARRALDWGFLISFAGNVTFPRALNLHTVAREIPLDHLLVETDAPYLAPQPVRGKRNEPAYVVETAAALGRLHGVSGEEMGARTTENFLRLFPQAGG